MSKEQASSLYDGNKRYVEFMGDELPLSEARFLVFRQDYLYSIIYSG